VRTKQKHKNEVWKAYQHQSVAKKSGDINGNPNKHKGKGFHGIKFRRQSLSSSHWIHTKSSANESLQKKLLNALSNVFIRPEMLEMRLINFRCQSLCKFSLDSHKK
jgi:hypothetical protein